MKILFILDHPFPPNVRVENEMKAFSHLTFHAETEEYLNDVLRDYLSYHLDVRDLKSEPYISLL